MQQIKHFSRLHTRLDRQSKKTILSENRTFRANRLTAGLTRWTSSTNRTQHDCAERTSTKPSYQLERSNQGARAPLDRESAPNRYKRETGKHENLQKKFQKTYSQIIVSVKKDTATKFRAKCEEKGISYSQVLKKAIEEFLSK